MHKGRGNPSPKGPAASSSSNKTKKKIGLKMTYCVGILVKDGLVMIADTRTNAGLDNISTYRKLHTLSLIHI